MHKNSLCLAVACLAALSALSNLSAQSVKRYGVGTAGTNQRVPLLWVTSMPRPGNSSFGLEIANGLLKGVAIPMLAANEATVQLGGLTVLLDLQSLAPLSPVLLDGNGAGTVPLPLPNSTSLVGISLVSQAFIPDPAAPTFGLAATQGLRFKIATFGLLLGTRSTGASNTPHIAINLDTGMQSSYASASMSNVGRPDIHPGDRTHCVMGSGLSGKVALFDCQVFPPKFVKEFASKFTPWCVKWHPDKTRLYVVNQSSAANQPSIDVYWGLPTVPNFGTPFTGPSIPLGNIIDADRLEFTSNGDFGILSTLGLFGGGGDLRKYDTKQSSLTYHQQLGNYKLSGRYIFDMCRVDDGRFAIAHAGFGGNSTIELIDIQTMKSLKAWGGQRWGTVIRGMVTDGSGRYLYIGNSPSGSTTAVGEVVRINIDPKDPSYGTQVNYTAGITSGWGVYDVVLNDSADRVYALVGAGIQSSFVGAIHEYDASSRKLLRTWNMNGLGNTYHLLIR